MGERKVLNKWYPPDFDPAKLPRGNRTDDNEMKVRMMLPMSVRCKTCGNFMYKGTKFNTRKEDVLGEDYLGIQIFRFYWRCKNCAAEFTIKTDPQNNDYQVENGVTRNYEPWREQEVVKAQASKEREDEEAGNAMKALENRTLDSKREMDIMAALDEMRTLNSRHAKISTEDALAAVRRAAEQQQAKDGDPTGQLLDEDLEGLQDFYRLKRQALAQARGRPDSSPSGSSGDDDGAARRKPGGAKGPAKKGGVAGMGTLAAGSGQASTVSTAAQEGAPQGRPQQPPAVSKPPVQAPAKQLAPVVKVVVKPKRPAPPPAAGTAMDGGGPGKKPHVEGGSGLLGLGEGSDKEGSGDGGGVLLGLGGYGSSDSG